MATRIAAKKIAAKKVAAKQIAAKKKAAAPKKPAPKPSLVKKAVAQKAVAKKAALKPAVPAAKKPVAKATPQAAPKPAPLAPPAPSTVELQKALESAKQFFDRSTSVLDETDAAFVPQPGMFSAAQHVAHVAQTFDWFLEGAFRPEGFDMDFPGMEVRVRAITSLAAARAWFDQAYGRLQQALKARPAAQWHMTIPANTIMGGQPRTCIVDGLVDHTAHHRGALTIYARLRNKAPLMPYM